MEKATKGFGLPALKVAGAPAHPDFWGVGCNPASGEISDEQYLKQLQAYKDEVAGDKVYKTMCSRPWLLKELK